MPFRRGRRIFHIIPRDSEIPLPAVMALSDRLAVGFRAGVNFALIQFPEVRIFHMTADRPELVRHTGAVNDQRGCSEG
jgi:hypothetical protein